MNNSPFERTLPSGFSQYIVMEKLVQLGKPPMPKLCNRFRARITNALRALNDLPHKCILAK
jgi:hypothetical protein